MSSTPSESPSFHTLRWIDNSLELLDQRALPQTHCYLRCHSLDDVIMAIKNMVVRGAPAIGVAAAYGAVLAFREQGAEADLTSLREARPTAVNLQWAVDRMLPVVRKAKNEADILAVAQTLHEEDVAANRRMGELGAGLIAPGSRVLTHCNAGALATAGYGTALGVIRAAHAQGKLKKVYADETRPWLQGSRLTAWELLQDQIPVTLLVEGAAAWLMKQGEVDWVITGADRVAANGDAANKIGTYALALAAKAHGVKMMVVAPTSTVDLACSSGNLISIESRDASEVLAVADQHIAALGAEAWNPVFDVTPAELITAIVTEKGVIHSPHTPKSVLSV